ncbi:MAG TPA: PEP-CTERM sorting domain-containing protein [Candidatus Acidoferrum sp.]|jgi:hypothetical protein|nr:PEP-CTERM sorting domain-containing protein [Candidatus Acidoferrum sp.]
MSIFINQRKPIVGMALTAAAVLGLGAIHAQAQSITYNFSDGLNDGWFNGGFNDTTAATVQNIGGQNYIYFAVGGFQVGNVTGGSALNAAMGAAWANPSGYDLSYTYSVNTAALTGATYLQLGAFANPGSGYYTQDYGGNDANEPQLNGTQLASGSVITGTVTVPFTVFDPAGDTATETSFRLGLIENSNATAGGVDFTSITIAPVPEPATLALAGLGGLSAFFLRRRKA